MRPVPVPHRRLAQVIVGLALLIGLLGGEIQAEDEPRRVALVVGVGDYDKREFITLRQPENDADGLAAELRRLRFDKVVVMKGSSPGALRATAENIVAQLRALLVGITKNDVVLVALSGHGQQVTVKQANGEFVEEDFFCPVEAIDGDASTMLKIATLTDDILRPRGGRNMLLIDACRDNPTEKRKKGTVAGRFKGVPGHDITLPRNTAILFSCADGQVSLERDDLHHSVFTLGVIEALQAGRTSWLGLAEFVETRVPALNPAQTPVATGSGLINLAPAGGVNPLAPRFAESIGLKIMPIRPGEFLMGTTDEQIALIVKQYPNTTKSLFEDEQPQHRVRITKLQGLSAYEITVGQFRRFVEDEGYKTEAERDGKGGSGFNVEKGEFEKAAKYTWRDPGFAQSDDHPVVNVSWNDAVAFCRWLSRKDGRVYRLPTEAEWEYCCRAGTETLYWNGDDPEGLARIGNMADSSLKARFGSKYSRIGFNKRDDGHVFTAPVGRFTSNEWGLYDMHGNVNEWCLDNNDRGYYKELTADDPRGPATASGRVIRGGCWHSDGRNCRSAFRNWGSPGVRSFDLGFRVARVSSE